jgi:hypothetical protein
MHRSSWACASMQARGRSVLCGVAVDAAGMLRLLRCAQGVGMQRASSDAGQLYRANQVLLRPELLRAPALASRKGACRALLLFWCYFKRSSDAWLLCWLAR